MSDNRKGPALNGAVPDRLVNESTPAIVAPADDTLARRRAAALRMPPMLSGHRDPIDDRPPLPEYRARELCRVLWAQGWDIDYLERRYGIERISA